MKPLLEPVDAVAESAHQPDQVQNYARQTYLTAREAADFLRFPSVKAFHMWQRRQGIRSFRTGKRKLLFARKDLERAISSGVRRAV